MARRVFTYGVAGGSTVVGAGLIIATLNVAKVSPSETPTLIAESLPRPAFSLDERYRAKPGRIGTYEVAQISSEEVTFIQSLTRRAAAVFRVPEHLLEHEVGRAALSRLDGTGLRLAPLSTEMIRDLNVPPDGETTAAADALVDFLGHDPRPFDSFLSRSTELGIGARAAYLRSQHSMLSGHLESLGIVPAPETLWFLAMLGANRGNTELTACLEEGLVMGPERLGRALADLRPTTRLLSDRSFVLRAFLKVWREAEARERRDAFTAEVEHLVEVFDRPLETAATLGEDTAG